VLGILVNACISPSRRLLTLCPRPQQCHVRLALGILKPNTSCRSGNGVCAALDGAPCRRWPTQVAYVRRGAALHRIVSLMLPTNQVRCPAQCYLKDSTARLEADIARAEREGWKFAAKTVRGAYLVFERARAAALGTASPVQDTLQATHANYDRRVPIGRKGLKGCCGVKGCIPAVPAPCWTCCGALPPIGVRGREQRGLRVVVCISRVHGLGVASLVQGTLRAMHAYTRPVGGCALGCRM